MPKTRNGPQFADFKAKNEESHTILDFQVGRDVGLGFGQSTASFGVRMAELTSKSTIGILARPEMGFIPHPNFGKHDKIPVHTDYQASAGNERSFHGIGPSISRNGDVPVLGGEDRAITFDWGVNGALLFGRQKAKGTHKEDATYYTGFWTGNAAPNYPGVFPVYDHPSLPHNRSRSVVVPNVGFLAGFSFRYPGSKISFGYHAVMFFGAMDMGVDARDIKDRNFYGPFATISIGFGG